MLKTIVLLNIFYYTVLHFFFFNECMYASKLLNEKCVHFLLDILVTLYFDSPFWTFCWLWV